MDWGERRSKEILPVLVRIPGIVDDSERKSKNEVVKSALIAV